MKGDDILTFINKEDFEGATIDLAAVIEELTEWQGELDSSAADCIIEDTLDTVFDILFNNFTKEEELLSNE